MRFRERRRVDTVIISDVHLGTYGCHAQELLRYLRSIAPRRLILNGDIIDGWQFSRSYFPSYHIRVVPSLKFKHMHLVEDWLNEDVPIKVDYPDNAAHIAHTIVAAHSPHAQLAVNALGAVA